MNFSINWGNRDDFVRSHDGGQKYIEVNEKSSSSRYNLLIQPFIADISAAIIGVGE